MKSVILLGDVRQRLSEIPEGSVRTCITSPPYFGLRDYGEAEQIGLEATPDAYVAEMVLVFREVWRVLADDGTLWLNLGDSYGKGKQLIGIPWRVAFALQADGWYLRQDIIWAKPNPMPESVRDRCTKSHEYVFLLSKSPRYYYDHEAVKEDAITPPKARNKNAEGYVADFPSGERFSPGERVYGADGKRNKRDVWTINTKPFKGAHFAVMPEALVEPCVLAGSADGDTVLDPFTGSGTVAVVANRHGRNFVGTELSPEYAEIAKARIKDDSPMLNEVEVI